MPVFGAKKKAAVVAGMEGLPAAPQVPLLSVPEMSFATAAPAPPAPKRKKIAEMTDAEKQADKIRYFTGWMNHWQKEYSAASSAGNAALAEQAAMKYQVVKRKLEMTQLGNIPSRKQKLFDYKRKVWIQQP